MTGEMLGVLTVVCLITFVHSGMSNTTNKQQVRIANSKDPQHFDPISMAKKSLRNIILWPTKKP